jgi:sodium/potassium-transporting ATPase subunit alpha
MRADTDGHLSIIMKGAPERILNRCSHILVDGKVIPFDEEQQAKVNSANERCGKMGERVLAIARYNLEPELYPILGKSYQFDIKGWKNWKEAKERDWI